MKQQVQAKKALFLAALTIASPVVLSTLNSTMAAATTTPALTAPSENEQKNCNHQKCDGFLQQH